MKIEQWKLSDIKPYPGNPRQNDAAVDAVAASIKEFGFRQPIVVDPEGVIVVGHTRYKAALKLGLETVPVHVARGLTPIQIKAYRIADNKTSDLATWDLNLLPEAFQFERWRKAKSLDDGGNVVDGEAWQECMSFDLHGDHRDEYEALVEELQVMPAWHDAEGRMYLPPKQRKQGETERKVTIHDLLGRSPDRADALALAYWARVAGRKVIPRVDGPMAYVEDDENVRAPKKLGEEGGKARQSLADRLFGPALTTRRNPLLDLDWGD